MDDRRRTRMCAEHVADHRRCGGTNIDNAGAVNSGCEVDAATIRRNQTIACARATVDTVAVARSR